MSPVVFCETPGQVVDFEVDGVLRVRTWGARGGDLAAAARDLGPPEERGGGPPDVTVHFVDDLSAAAGLLPQDGTAGDRGHGTRLFDSSGRTPIAWVSRGRSWGKACIVCVHGLKRVPLLAVSRDLAALRRGWVPLHGSAWVTKEGVGVLVTGSAGSGKTGALLAACEAGASPIGDDRIMLSADGSRMMGLVRPVTVKDWHLAQLRLPVIGARPVRRALARACLGLTELAVHDGSRHGRWAARAMGRLGRELSLDVDLQAFTRLPRSAGPTRPRVLTILEAHQYPEIISRPVEPGVAASHIAAQVADELAPALRAHGSREDDDPAPGWTDVWRAPEMAAGFLRNATRSIPTFLVRHPHPCSLERLREVLDALGRDQPRPVAP